MGTVATEDDLAHGFRPEQLHMSPLATISKVCTESIPLN
uniref:Uncharacterized protein n=1 Tax=Triticum urartu TaxID=4572 RepID=A0A8R7TQ78_TRIUA